MGDGNELLRRRRDRAIAICLGLKEREVDQFLPPAVAQKLRKVILDQFNGFYEDCLDVSGAADATVVTNQIYLDKLERIHGEIASVREAIEATA